ncbi:FepA family TonB-dependent siderophore receptor [Kerstersia gyiorum]|nr:FepA family TonB-dependent siderophore receptor [Kerstersia gyiorum]KAB0543194.1 TonB-dependent receptor [Kerstersia gyiorum]
MPSTTPSLPTALPLFKSFAALAAVTAMIGSAPPVRAQPTTGTHGNASPALLPNADTRPADAATRTSPANGSPVSELESVTVEGLYERRQTTGQSVISAQDIRKMPVTNDLAEIIRKQPGAALTTASTSGQYGNKRQISLRGMGPENTLILIDGRPVLSRNAVRMGWRGDRNTRGDTNWIPAEMVDSIRVIRGPAAAIYGNGAAGGVVNIITKKAGETWSTALSTTQTRPQDGKEGDGQRYNFSLMGPLTDSLSLRLYGNYNRIEEDAWDINREHEGERSELLNGTHCDVYGNHCRTGYYSYVKTFTAGREGLVNKDGDILLSWRPSARQTLSAGFSYGRQDNLYSGEAAYNNIQNGQIVIDGFKDPRYSQYGGKQVYYMGTDVSELLGTTTNSTTRKAYALSHDLQWERASVRSFLQVEETDINRLVEGLAGGGAGSLLSSTTSISQKAMTSRTRSNLRTTTLKSEWALPFSLLGTGHFLTAGVEYQHSRLNDPESMSQSLANLKFSFNVPGFDPDIERSPQTSASIWSVFLADEIEPWAGMLITPAIRYDHHSLIESAISPSLNLQQAVGGGMTLHAGIGQTYKAPNLYQLNPNYLLYSNGNGCFHLQRRSYSGQEQVFRSPCFLQGNDRLKPEASINMELGIEYQGERLSGTLTYFRNDYRNRIEAGTNRRHSENTYTQDGLLDLLSIDIYRWVNVRKTLLEGLEGSVQWDITDSLQWTNAFSYMHRFETYDKDLSNAYYTAALDNTINAARAADLIAVLPRYTLVSNLNWQATPALMLSLTGSFYGTQKPAQLNEHNISEGFYARDLVSDERKAYMILDFASSFEWNRHITLSAGIKNVLDRRLYRLGNATSYNTAAVRGAGANTYNEPGRAFYLGLNAQF